MRIDAGAVALRIPLFQSAHEELRSALEPPWPRWMRDLYHLDAVQDPEIAVEEGTTTIPAALGALSARLHHRLQLIASITGGLQRQGWELHIEGDVLLATRAVDPRHALEMLEEQGLAGSLCALADLDDSGWPRLYTGLEAVT